MRRLLAVVVCLAVLGAGCGDEEPVRETTPDTSELDAVEVDRGEPGEAPTLTFDEPFEVDETTRQRAHRGRRRRDRRRTRVVTFDFVFVNGRDGTELEHVLRRRAGASSCSRSR